MFKTWVCLDWYGNQSDWDKCWVFCTCWENMIYHIYETCGENITDYIWNWKLGLIVVCRPDWLGQAVTIGGGLATQGARANERGLGCWDHQNQNALTIIAAGMIASQREITRSSSEWDHEMFSWRELFLKIPLHQSIKSLLASPGEQMNVQGWEVLAAGLSHLHNSHREQLVLFRLHIFSKWPLLAYFLWALDRFRSKVGQATLCIFVSYFIVCQQCCHPCWTFHKLGCLLCLKVDWGCSYLHINLRKHNRQTINSPIWMYPVYTLFQYWIFIIVYLQNWVKMKLNLYWFVYLGLSIDWLRCQAAKLRMPCLLTWICVEMGSLKVLSQKAIFGFCWDTIWLVSRPTRWSIWNLIFGCLCRSSIFSNPSDREI